MAESRKSSLAILFLTVFINMVGFGILIPLLPLYALRLGASVFTIGLLFTTFSLAQLISAPVWGRLSDRIGRRAILIVTAAGSAIAYALFGLADTLLVLFASRVLGGACSASIATAQAYVADVTTPEQRGRGMALIGAALGAGFVFGPALAGVTAHWWGIRAPFFIAAGLSLVNAVWTLIALPEPERHEAPPVRGVRAILDAFRLPVLAFYVVIFFVVVYAFSHIEVTFPLWNFDELGFGARDNGWIFAYIGFVLSLVQAVGTPRLIGRFGESRLIAVGAVTIALGCAMVPAFVHGWLALAAACTLIAGGNALVTPSLTSAISRNAPAHRQGEMLGVAQSMASLARIAGPSAGTFLYGHAGHAWPYATTAVLLFVTGLAVSARQAERTGTPTAR